jgi:beta-glucosidase
MSFRDDFVWGVASASYQVEGAAAADGKGPSVWDMFCRKEGAVWHGQNGDVACDHYHRYRDDVALMSELGIQAYRFSVSWPRVLPEGAGAVNAAGLDFYDRLVDELIGAGIDPWVTLFHWDYPLALYHRGGWLNRDSVEWFAEYTQVLVDRLSDRVTHWMTHNEPQCFIGLGHQTGYHAPGDSLRFDEVARAAHHTLLAHGRAVQTIREHAKAPPSVGSALVAQVRVPATESTEDIEAARLAMFTAEHRSMFTNTWWMDPMLRGEYPVDGLELFGDAAPRFTAEDMALICQPLDFLGVNIYSGIVVESDKDRPWRESPLPAGYPKTTQDFWHVLPQSLYWGPRLLHERYGLPVVITENGHQNADVVSLDGKVHDPQRIDYLNRYLRELKRANTDGTPVKGYFQWCFTDNFEWAMGDAIRVGLVFTDYPMQRRIPKDSAYWYRDTIASNGESL